MPGPAEAAGSAVALEEADSIYDDFDDPTFEGALNRELWDVWDNINGCDLGQEAGVLRFSCHEPNGSGLTALDYAEVPFGEFDFIETGLRLDDDIQTNNGAVIVKIYTSLDRWAECGLSGGRDSDAAYIYCGVYIENDTEYEVEGPATDYDTWRTIRLELDPETAAITFVVDGQELGTYTTPDAAALKEADLTVELHIYFEEGTLVTGYFDDVHIGP
jgi:hypothetical protein